MHGIMTDKIEKLEEDSDTLADNILRTQIFDDDFISNYRKKREELHTLKKKMEILPNEMNQLS
jgi:hypothetical protein